MVVDQFRLSYFDVFFGARSSASRALGACAATYVAVLGATFFYRSSSFSRIFVAISAVLLLMMAILSQQVFRVLMDRTRRKGDHRIRLLIIGADQFADRTARSLEQGAVPCAISALIRLSGQDVAVTGGPVIGARRGGAIHQQCRN